MTRTRERIDRKTLKQDELLNLVTRISDFAEKNRNLFFGVLGAVLLVIVGGVMWQRSQAQRKLESQDSYSQVLAAFAGGQFETALGLATNVQTQYPNNRGGVLAVYMAGACQLQLGKFSEAEKSFRDYLSRAAKAPFYESAAKQGLAAAIESQGRHAEAAAAYQDAAAAFEDPVASQLRLDAARSFIAAGEAAQAKDILAALAEGKTSVAHEAKTQLAALQSLGAVAAAGTQP